MSTEQVSREEQVKYLAKRFKIPEYEADTLLENMTREASYSGGDDE